MCMRQQRLGFDIQYPAFVVNFINRPTSST
jgi:hypothetical protein